MKKILIASVVLFIPFMTAMADAKKPLLKYATSYKEAVDAARDRNTIIFATFHKDH